MKVDMGQRERDTDDMTRVDTSRHQVDRLPIELVVRLSWQRSLRCVSSIDDLYIPFPPLKKNYLNK